MGRPAKIIIDLEALRHNVNQVKCRAPTQSLLAMVKSNAYGHGLQQIGKALENASALGVACIEEGLMLRKAGIKTPIVLMEGLFAPEELKVAAENHFTLIVHHAFQLKMLERSIALPPFPVWLKIDTGMHRLGFAMTEIPAVYQKLIESPLVQKPIGLMTHFAESDLLDRDTTQQQIRDFHATCKHFPGPRSLANSAAIIAWPESRGDWVRPGIMLYGASPFKGQIGESIHLRPVMSLCSELIAIHDIQKGDRVGYGGTYTAPEKMRIGVVAMGYGDGYPQFTPNGTPVLINGRSCPLAGRVSMDMLTVDLRSEPEAKIGDSVLLWGPGLPVEKIAENNHTSAYELLTRITERVPKHYKFIL